MASILQDTPSPEIVLDAPVVVSQAPLGLKNWGPWQFPAIQRLRDGRLQIGYHVAEDSAADYGTQPGGAISADSGHTWTLMKSGDTPPAPSWASKTLLLPNGDLLRQIQMASRKIVDVQEKLPAPFSTEKRSYGVEQTLCPAKKLPPEFAGWRFTRLQAGNREWVEEHANVHIPGAMRTVTEGVLSFPWIHRIEMAPDGSLWGIMHSKREVDGVLQKKHVALFIRSTDAGHTWDVLSEIPYQPDGNADRFRDKRDGFTEPNIAFLPDGSVFCLMRTTDGHGVGPLYWSHSTDNGKTWSEPVVFDDCGVWPALLTLENGVTLAAYGRPGLYIRATNDPAGQSWARKVAVIRPGELHKDTCSYSDLIALNDYSALIVYSDFNYPDEKGQLRKTILARKITLD